MQSLFSQVRSGTPVRIINQPVKFAVEPDGKRYVEVHRPLTSDEGSNTQTMAYTHPAEFHQFAGNKAIDEALLKRALTRRAGYPVAVSGSENATSTLSVQNAPVDEAKRTQ